MKKVYKTEGILFDTLETLANHLIQKHKYNGMTCNPKERTLNGIINGKPTGDVHKYNIVMLYTKWDKFEDFGDREKVGEPSKAKEEPLNEFEEHYKAETSKSDTCNGCLYLAGLYDDRCQIHEKPTTKFSPACNRKITEWRTSGTEMGER